MRVLFLSDVHLGAFSEAVQNELETALKSLIDLCIKEKIQIYLLGDLFDYWMEYPDFISPLGKSVLDRFEKYNSKCGPAYFITGNHDFWDRGHFADRGFIVEYEFLRKELFGKQFLLFHGDGLSAPKFELPRPCLHQFLRNPSFVRCYQNVFSGETGNHLMKVFSEFTRDDRNPDPGRLSRWARFFLDKTVVDYIITGHDHLPRMETFSTGTYINTGAFFRDRTLLLYTEEGPDLVSYSDGKLNAFTL